MPTPTVLNPPLLAAGVGLIGLALGWFANGLGFLIKRKLARTPQSERAAYLSTVTEIATRLRSNGMTIDDVHALEEVLRNPSIGSSDAVSSVLTTTDAVTEPDAFHSNFAMKARARAAYDVAEAQLRQALIDLQLVTGGDAEMDDVQAKWVEYRTAMENRELAKFPGGTHATLALTLAGLAETERRTHEIRAEIIEMAAR